MISPASAAAAAIAGLARWVRAWGPWRPTKLRLEVETQTINGAIAFEIEPRRKKMLLEGLDEIGLTLAMEPKIAAFQAADRARRPWIYPG